MYTIVMNPYKQLVTTNHPKIFQRDKLVDKFQFLFPTEYEGLDLTKATWRLEYVDPGNVVHSEKLIQSDDLYKDMIECVLDIDTNLTKVAGTISHLNVTATIFDVENQKQYVMHTEPIEVVIYPIEDLYSFNADESLAIMDQFAIEMDAKIAAIDKAAEKLLEDKVDDLKLDETTNHLTLVSGEKEVGNGVTIDLIVEEDKELDKLDKHPNDGVIDLDDIDWDIVNV